MPCIKISDSHLHVHLKARMAQRGITRKEIERTLNKAWQAKDAKSGTIGKVFVFRYDETFAEPAENRRCLQPPE